MSVSVAIPRKIQLPFYAFSARAHEMNAQALCGVTSVRLPLSDLFSKLLIGFRLNLVLGFYIKSFRTNFILVGVGYV
jgi:hypothetical protein